MTRLALFTTFELHYELMTGPRVHFTNMQVLRASRNLHVMRALTPASGEREQLGRHYVRARATPPVQTSFN
ncbi:unnamed protein product, partial [Brenthis ino]